MRWRAGPSRTRRTSGARPGPALVELSSGPRRPGRRALFRGELRPAREAARELLDELRGEDDALTGVERILSEGGAPKRQRAIHAQGGMSALLRALVEETAQGTSLSG